MKKYLSILAITAMASSAFAQGTVVFANNNNSLVKLGTSPSDPAATALASGWAQLFAAPSGTAYTAYTGDPAAWKTANVGWAFVGTPTAVGTLAAGRFNGGTVTNTAIAGGAAMEAVIVAWNGNFNSFDAAVAGSAAVGASGKIHLAATGNPLATPPTLATTLISGTGLSGATIAPTGPIIPEPTSLALVGLGAAAMLVIRRRK